MKPNERTFIEHSKLILCAQETYALISEACLNFNTENEFKLSDETKKELVSGLWEIVFAPAIIHDYRVVLAYQSTFFKGCRLNEIHVCNVENVLCNIVFLSSNILKHSDYVNIK